MKTILHLQLPFCDVGYNKGSKSRSLCVAEWEKLQILFASHHKDLLFFVVWGRSGQGERSDPCTYGTFFKASRQSLGEDVRAVKRMSLHPIQERHVDGWVGGENRQCKGMMRDERVHVCVQRREKGKERWH